MVDVPIQNTGYWIHRFLIDHAQFARFPRGVSQKTDQWLVEFSLSSTIALA